MACAGHLVLNNSLVVYAEILHGVLVCTEARHHLEQRSMEPEPEQEPEACDNADAGANALPLLAPKSMARTPSCVLPKQKLRRESAHHKSIVLSGHAVEVVDINRLDDALPALPHTFIVKTKRMDLQQDGSFSSTDVGCVQLAAVDEQTKAEWMKRIEKWHRYGWRDTTLIHASTEDMETLETIVVRWYEDAINTPANLEVQLPTPLRSTRRRFYRALAPSSSLGMDDGGNDLWFQTRVVKTTI